MFGKGVNTIHYYCDFVFEQLRSYFYGRRVGRDCGRCSCLNGSEYLVRGRLQWFSLVESPFVSQFRVDCASDSARLWRAAFRNPLIRGRISRKFPLESVDLWGWSAVHVKESRIYGLLGSNPLVHAPWFTGDTPTLPLETAVFLGEEVVHQWKVLLWLKCSFLFTGSNTHNNGGQDDGQGNRGEAEVVVREVTSPHIRWTIFN